jgi:hypothetical protein
VADLDHTAEPGQGFLIHLLVPEQIVVIEKIAQEPAELPKCLRSAIEPPGDNAPSKFVGFEDRQPQDVERFLGMPAVADYTSAD